MIITGHVRDLIGPSLNIGPSFNLQAALGHEHHAAPASEVGDRAGVADQPVSVYERGVNNVESVMR